MRTGITIEHEGFFEMVFPLARTRQWRRLDTWAPLWGLITLGGVGYWLGDSLLSAQNVWLQLATVIGGIILLVLFGEIAWSELKETFGSPGRIELNSSEIVLKSPKWFRQPLRIPLSQVRLVAFDEWSGDKRRFPIAGVHPQSRRKDREAWLWRKNREAALPTLNLNPLDEIPNLAIVFDPPVEMTGQKTLKTFVMHSASFVNRRIRVVTALVDNPREAWAKFSAVGLLREPAIADVSALHPSPEERRQARRYNVVAIAIGILVFGSWIGGVIWSAASGD